MQLHSQRVAPTWTPGNHYHLCCPIENNDFVHVSSQSFFQINKDAFIQLLHLPFSSLSYRESPPSFLSARSLGLVFLDFLPSPFHRNSTSSPLPTYSTCPLIIYSGLLPTETIHKLQSKNEFRTQIISLLTFSILTNYLSPSTKQHVQIIP